MIEISSDQNNEVLHFEVAFLESAAEDGRDNINAVTHGVCTAMEFCLDP